MLCLGPFHHNVTQSRTCSAFYSHRNSSPGCVYATIRSPFRPFCLYPGADCTVHLAFLFCHAYGNPDLFSLHSIFRVCVPIVYPVFSLRAVCSVCLLAPYDLGVGFVMCVCVCFALCGVCGSCCASVSRSPAHALPSFHTETLSPDAYTTTIHFRLGLRTFSCTSGPSVQWPLHFHFTTSAGRRVRTSSPVRTA